MSKQDIKNYAILASESYRYYNNRVDEQVPSLIDDSTYHLVPDLSDSKSVLYVNNLRREIVLSLRGTQNFNDIVTDISVYGITTLIRRVIVRIQRKNYNK